MSISPMESRPLGKSFEPQTFEQEVYSHWESKGCFEANDQNEPGQKAFAIVIPPPNVTGALHVGHALTNTMQDILIRWHRMLGDNTLWLPGTDHAGIATQTQVEKWIKPQTRQALGREAFLKKVWEWKELHGSQISNQSRRMGASLDWKRERFTMDEGFSKAVREVFVRLYEEGLIYRGERIINWSVGAQTALSDLEVVPTERKGKIWQIRYPVVEKDGKPVMKDGSPAYLTIATTRPETLLGDTAVAIHPEDERYAAFHGKYAKLPLVGKILPIILDAYVDRGFGTGALKVTPAHDFNDYELGKKHDLPFVSVMGKDGAITAEGGAYAGLKFAQARERVLADLEAQGLLGKIEDHVHKVGLCQRTGTVAEPIVSMQWFIKIDPLAKPAIEAVEKGKIEFTPKNWEKTYFEWMYNIRDWCISRQLWWGHRIPAWHCAKCGETRVAREAPAKCGKCGAGGADLRQDEDVLDTWFSSSLWPFGTLGWPEKTQALQTFYPNSVLETGFDIIFFWVARMIMMGLHFMGQPPFAKVYLHAMVRDEKGEKMSKTRGNVIDPLELIEAHGADPLRFTLAIMAGQGRDIKLSKDRVEGYRAFCNKLWNAVKFFLLQWDAQKGSMKLPELESMEAWLEERHSELSTENRWILSRLQALTDRVTQGFERFEINDSAQALYDFTWHELCDWYLELSKLSFREGGTKAEASMVTLHYALDRLLRLLHPIAPFVTEELWRSLPRKSRSPRRGLEILMLQAFPKKVPTFASPETEAEIHWLKSVVEAIRNFRGENNLSPKVEFTVAYAVKAGGAETAPPSKHALQGSAEALLRKHEPQIKALARINGFVTRLPASETQAVIPLAELGLEFKVELKGLVNFEEEIKRVNKEIAKVRSDLDHVNKKLSSPQFVGKAPEALVAKEKQNAAAYRSKLAELESSLRKMQAQT